MVPRISNGLIVTGGYKYRPIYGWSQAFNRKVVNHAYGGDRIEHLVYRIETGVIPKNVRLAMPFLIFDF